MWWTLGFTWQSLFCSGVEVLNSAIETLHSGVPSDKWTYVNVTVAPSSITISDHEVNSWLIDWLTLFLWLTTLTLMDWICVYLSGRLWFVWFNSETSWVLSLVWHPARICPWTCLILCCILLLLHNLLKTLDLLSIICLEFANANEILSFVMYALLIPSRNILDCYCTVVSCLDSAMDSQTGLLNWN